MNAVILPLSTAGLWRALAAALTSSFIGAAAAAQVMIPPEIPGGHPIVLQPLGNNWPLPGTSRSMNERGRPVPRGPFFLPALLPVLGATPARANRESLAADYPRESAGEPYFMAEGNLASSRLLSEKNAEHIASYRTARLTLLTELRMELNRGPEVSPEARQIGLATLAAAQTPLLLDLETEAEKIRYDLTHVEVLKITADDIGRFVPPDENPAFRDALAAVRMLLSAAHFREGFSPDQRRLLEEMAQEVRLTIEPDLASSRAVFFWPAGARILVPLDLDPETTRKFAEFQARKAALKKDLRAWLDSERRQVFNLDYTDDFERLAAAQAPRFAELDARADELRPALAARANTAKPVASPLPDDLTRQVAALAERKAALQRELQARLAEFRRQLPGDRIDLVQNDSGLAVIIVTDHGNPEDRARVFASITAFNQGIAVRFHALVAERDAVRAAISRYHATVAGDQPGVTVEKLAADFLAAYRARETQDRQHDYAAAVFTSGLSPAQRRLLLTAATADSLQQSSLSAPPPIAASLR